MCCRTRRFFIAVIAVSGIGQMIAACGQKGDLYLPEPERKSAQRTETGTETDPARHGTARQVEADADADAEPGRE